MKPSNLTFRPDGTFRVLMMSDLQESASYDPRSLRSVEALLDECDPDLVILGGDNCYGVDKRRGGRLFIYREETPEAVETRMVRTLDKL